MKEFINIPKGEPKAQLGARVPKELKNKTDAIAAELNVTTSDLVIAGLEGVVEKHKFNKILLISTAIRNLKEDEDLPKDIIKIIRQTEWDRSMFSYFDKKETLSPLVVAAKMHNEKIFDMLLENRRDSEMEDFKNLNYPNPVFNKHYTNEYGWSLFQSVLLENFKFGMKLYNKFRVNINHTDYNGNNILQQMVINFSHDKAFTTTMHNNLKEIMNIKKDINKNIDPIDINNQNNQGDTVIFMLLKKVMIYGDGIPLAEFLNTLISDEHRINLSITNHNGRKLKDFIKDLQLYPKRNIYTLEILKKHHFIS